MPDIDSLFIATLLSAPKQEQEEFYSRQVPLSVFRQQQARIHWLFRHRERFGKFPSRQMYEAHFKDQLPQSSSDSVVAALQTVVDQDMYAQMQKAQEKVNEAIEAGTDMTSVMQMYKTTADKLSGFSVELTDIPASSNTALKQYLARSKQLKDPNAKLVTPPWKSLEVINPFLAEGDTAVIAARYSIGKTWAMLWWAHHVALKRGVPTLFVTKEMMTETILARLECLRFRLSYPQFRSCSLTPMQAAKWQAERIKRRNEKYPLIVTGDEQVQGSGYGPIIAKIKQYDPKVVFIDGAYLLRPDDLPKTASERERYSHISNRAKSLAKSMRKIIIMSIQSNRETETATGVTKGTGRGLYGSDAWGQDADLVLYLNGKRGAPSRTVEVGKGRESGLGEFPINFRLDPNPDFSETAASFNPSVVNLEGL